MTANLGLGGKSWITLEPMPSCLLQPLGRGATALSAHLALSLGEGIQSRLGSKGFPSTKTCLMTALPLPSTEILTFTSPADSMI